MAASLRHSINQLDNTLPGVVFVSSAFLVGLEDLHRRQCECRPCPRAACPRMAEKRKRSYKDDNCVTHIEENANAIDRRSDLFRLEVVFRHDGSSNLRLLQRQQRKMGISNDYLKIKEMRRTGRI